MNNPSVLARCTVQKPSGSFCDVRSLIDSPFPICRGHAEMIYRHYDADAEAKTASIVHALRGDLAARPKPDTSGYDARVERRERHKRLSDQSVVYYVRIGDHVKIGTTTNVRARLIGLRVDPAALLATEPGSYELERRRHGEFAAERQGRRENFNPSPRLLAHIDTILAEHGDPVFTTYVSTSA